MLSSDLLDKLNQFSCPQEAFNEQIFEAVAVSHANAAASLFLLRHRVAIAERTVGVVSFLESRLAQGLDFDVAWDAAFGRAQWALESEDVDVGDISLLLCLRFTACNFAGKWSGSLAIPVSPRFGRWLLPVAREMDVCSNGHAATLQLHGVDGIARTIEFERTGEDWTCRSATASQEVGVHTPILVVPYSAIQGQLSIEDQFNSITGYPAITAEVLAPLAEGLRLLKEYAPVYLRWVERVIRGIVVCQCSGTRTRSSTWSEAPGFILMSTSDDPMAVAEMLVHEASHQYFHLLGRLGLVDDGTDQRTFYSPAVRRPRPLSRVLIAYHAFANMALMYRTARLNGLPDGCRWVQVEARLLADAHELEEPLVGNRALSGIGRAICEPLMARLRLIQ